MTKIDISDPGASEPTLKSAIRALAFDKPKRIQGEEDDTEALQRRADTSAILDLAGLNLTLSRTVHLTDANSYVLGPANITIVTRSRTSAVFSGPTSKSFNLVARDLQLTGEATCFSVKLVGPQPNAGASIQATNIACIGSGRSTQSCMFDLRQVDMSTIDNVRAWSFESGVRIKSDYPTERDNTQIYLRNVIMTDCTFGAILFKTDKTDFLGFDVYGCGTGFLVEGANKKVGFNKCHVEHFGKFPDATMNMVGFGWHFADGHEIDAVLDQCTAYPLDTTGGKAGIYIGAPGQLHCPTVYARNCTISPTAQHSPDYKAIINFGRLIWEGPFPYTGAEVTLGSPDVAWTDTIIRDPTLARLKIASVQPKDLTNDVNSPSVKLVEQGAAYAATGVDLPNRSEKSLRISVHGGWHTLVASGYSARGKPHLFVRMEYSRPTMLKWQINGRKDQEATYRFPFYVPEPTDISFGVTADEESYIVIGSIAIWKGFGEDL